MRRLALLTILLLGVMSWTEAEVAGACPGDLDERVFVLGWTSLPFPERGTSKMGIVTFDDGSLALLGEAEVYFLSADAELRFVVPGDAWGVTEVGDLYRIYGQNLSIFVNSVGETVATGPLPNTVALAPNGASAVLAGVGMEGPRVVVYTPDGSVDERYPSAGIVTSDQLAPLVPSAGDYVRLADAAFVGEDIRLLLVNDPPNAGYVAAVYTANLSPDGGLTVSPAFELGKGLSTSGMVRLSGGEVLKSLLTIDRSSSDPLAFYVDWERDGTPEVKPIENQGSSTHQTVASADGSGWWVSIDYPGQPSFVFVTNEGVLDESIGRFENYDEQFNYARMTSDPRTGALRLTTGSSMIQFRGRTDPSVFQVGGLTDQVERLYVAGLGRQPDESGLSYWRALRANGMPLEEIATSFVGSPEFQSQFPGLSDIAFVEQLYRFVLGREAEREGAEYWTSLLENEELSRPEVLVYFSESPENVARTSTLKADPSGAAVYRLYEAFFERSPDVSGHCHWSRAIGDPFGDYPLEVVAQQFAGSEELQLLYGSLSDEEFVALVYENVLDRPPDSEGAVFWLRELSDGLSRGAMMARFSNSPEFRLQTDTVGR